MPKIIIDGKTVECREGIPVLQAALEAGWDVPHYCYHPGLSIVASCRLCLMEMKMPHPQTQELAWAPKLFPSCQTPVKDGMEVRFHSPAVERNQKHVMEYYLLNHPLDCPVCDKAGECCLQDYSERFGNASSRMIDEKYKNPKKDIGSKTLLYQDRCVLCTRCVRFADEVAGSGELRVIDRGHRAEIDVFPGVPLENELQGNVVDLCPVGALLSKDFLFKQRVWLLESTPSISPADSGGAAIWIDHNEQGIHRVRPRWNEKANGYWISDEQRWNWRYVHGDRRLRAPGVRRGGDLQPARWEELPEIVRYRFSQAAAADGGAACAAVLSPMMSCEEAWLLATFMRGVAPQSTLALGFVPVDGADKRFPKGFTIRAEKCPNRRGIERLIEHFGGATLKFDELVKSAAEGKFKAAYVVGGYPTTWVAKEHAAALAKIETLVVHDIFPSLLDASAAVQIPGASWAEREGTFMNCDGLLQPFERALRPLDGVKPDGQFLHELAGSKGLFRADGVRKAMASSIPWMADVFVPRPAPQHAH
ncbi:MAG: (2Fe-2S)-binding protein [Phycisphaerae bacterium]|jgi:NADH-quinone oxidoreductase subunit G